MKEISNDPVNHPSHYTTGKIECIDFIKDKELGFCLGNAVKYIVRAGKKDPDKTVEDLQKAVWYLNREIADLKGEDETENAKPIDLYTAFVNEIYKTFKNVWDCKIEHEVFLKTVGDLMTDVIELFEYTVYQKLV